MKFLNSLTFNQNLALLLLATLLLAVWYLHWTQIKAWGQKHVMPMWKDWTVRLNAGLGLALVSALLTDPSWTDSLLTPKHAVVALLILKGLNIILQYKKAQAAAQGAANAQ